MLVINSELKKISVMRNVLQILINFFSYGSLCHKLTLGLTALTHEMVCDQMMMGLPPVTSAVFLIAM
jgi:hypothetical protein